MSKIIIVEDEAVIRDELIEFLMRYGYEVESPTDFKNILEYIEDKKADLILLDINLPVFDGYYICREIRKKSEVPIVIVTSRDSAVDELLSMNLGADDYITKPYNTQILLARIEKILKRTYGGSTGGRILNYNDFSLNLSNATIEYNGKSTVLSKNELKILFFLMENKGTIVSRETLIGYLWKSDLFIDDSTLTVNMTRLRKRLEEVGIENPIETRRGLGYIMP